jgi:isochorismate hydrolase
MTIPAITPYPMPGQHDRYDENLRWRPDPARAALLIHDMQNYFVDFLPSERSPRTQLVKNTARIRESAAGQGVPVFYTAQPGNMTRAQRGLLRDVWGDGMGDDEYAKSILEELRPSPGDVVLTKWRYSAFARSDLGARLDDLGCDQLIICGVYAHVGCLMTACDAFTMDIETFLVSDAIADFSAEYHRLALSYAGSRCAATPATDEVVSALEAVPARN